MDRELSTFMSMSKSDRIKNMKMSIRKKLELFSNNSESINSKYPRMRDSVKMNEMLSREEARTVFDKDAPHLSKDPC